MSTLIVEVTTIDDILPHDNADTLELAKVKGWLCIVKKGQFKPKDKCIYVPIDSVLPESLETKLFENAKVKLERGRIKTIKLRGYISQGLVIHPEMVGLQNEKIGTDVREILDITKYEPPKRSTPKFIGQPTKKKDTNPDFKKYTDIENFKNYPNVFEEDELVCITEKIHGTNWRAGYVPSIANTFIKRIKKFFGRLPKYEFVCGSRNVQLKRTSDNFYSDNVYWQMVDKYNIKKILKEGEVLYGECYGHGIQKGYNYGCKEGQLELVVIDIMVDGKYLDLDDMRKFCIERELPYVPVLYYGPFNEERLIKLSQGESVLSPSQKIREGVVVKPLLEEQHPRIGRKILKYINDEYLLLKNNSDFH